MATVAVLGTGLLGSGFVERLLERGEQVRVYNRTASKLGPLVAKGAVATDTPAAAVRGVERVHLVLSEDDAVEAVIEAARPGLAAGTWVIDHSTNAPRRVAARHGRLRAEGVRYVHAPVFMAPADARAGSGLMLLATTTAEAEALTPALQTMTGRVWHVGERPDLAAVLKLAGNGMLISLAGTFGDLFTLGGEQGVPPEAILGLFEVFRVGGALPGIGARVVGAEQMTPSFETTMARKDVRLMIEAAGGEKGLTVLPGLAGALDAAIARGQGDRDFCVFTWRRTGLDHTPG